MINLNKKFLDKKSLFKYITDYDVFSKYIPDQEIIVGKNIYSPFRNESNPSFGFFIGDENEICFKDFTLMLKGDCVKFVMILFNLTYFEALSQIAIDFNMEDDFDCKSNSLKKTPSRGTINVSKDKALSQTVYKSKLGKIKRDWSLIDMTYWQKYHISVKTLNRYRVEPIKYITMGETMIKADDNAYCFKELKDGEETYKIYQPYNLEYKWLNSHNESVWQGWDQLPEKDEYGTLIITKSLKDVMCIVENTDCYAVSLQCENVIPKTQVIEELKERFGTIIILYDNDYDKEKNWGQIFGEELSNRTGFMNRHINSKYEAKDFTDLIEKYGKEKSLYIFNTEILLPF